MQNSLLHQFLQKWNTRQGNRKSYVWETVIGTTKGLEGLGSVRRPLWLSTERAGGGGGPDSYQSSAHSQPQLRRFSLALYFDCPGAFSHLGRGQRLHVRVHGPARPGAAVQARGRRGTFLRPRRQGGYLAGRGIPDGVAPESAVLAHGGQRHDISHHLVDDARHAAATAARCGAGRGQVRAGYEHALALWRILRRSPALFLIMLQGVGIFVLERICQVNLFQPILAARGFSVCLVRTVLSVTTIFEALGAARPDWLRKVLHDLPAVTVLTVVIAGSMSLIALTGQIGTFIGLCLFPWRWGWPFPSGGSS